MKTGGLELVRGVLDLPGADGAVLGGEPGERLLGGRQAADFPLPPGVGQEPLQVAQVLGREL